MQASTSDPIQLAWWVEINTSFPHCTYYFGPFDSHKEAQLARGCYVEDLYQERARDIIAKIKWCQPKLLTIVRQNVVRR